MIKYLISSFRKKKKQPINYIHLHINTCKIEEVMLEFATKCISEYENKRLKNGKPIQKNEFLGSICRGWTMEIKISGCQYCHFRKVNGMIWKLRMARVHIYLNIFLES